jgi:hypothetical protein
VRILDELQVNAEDVLDMNKEKLEARKNKNTLKGEGDKR